MWHVSRVYSLFFATQTTVSIKQGASVNCVGCLLQHEQLYQSNMEIVCFLSELFVYLTTVPSFLLVWGSLRLTPIKIGSMHFAKLNYCQMQFVERTPNIWATKISAYTVCHDLKSVHHAQALVLVCCSYMHTSHKCQIWQ